MSFPKVLLRSKTTNVVKLRPKCRFCPREDYILLHITITHVLGRQIDSIRNLVALRLNIKTSSTNTDPAPSTYDIPTSFFLNIFTFILSISYVFTSFIYTSNQYLVFIFNQKSKFIILNYNEIANINLFAE